MTLSAGAPRSQGGASKSRVMIALRVGREAARRGRAAAAQFTRFQVTLRQTSPPSAQPAVVRVEPLRLILPE